jgi:hypothetical protein
MPLASCPAPLLTLSASGILSHARLPKPHETTQIYLDANLALKEDGLKKTSPVNASVGRFKPDDQLLAFLRNL